MKKYLLISVLLSVLVLGGCAAKNNSVVTPTVSNNVVNSVVSSTPVNNPATNVPVVSSPTASSSVTEDNQAITSDKNVLIDTKHGVKITFPTTYAFSTTGDGRIYFGPKLAANVCKDEANGCSDNVALENTNGYNYALDFTPAKSVSDIFKELTLSTSSDGKIEYDNRNGEVPQTEKINGHDVVSFWTGGEGDSPYTMEVVGTKYNYVFQAEDQKLTEAEMQTDYDYIRAVIKNIEYLK
jgi:hypothetical protein